MDSFINQTNKAGQTIAGFKFAVATLIAAVLFVIAVFMYRREFPYDANATGEVIEADCVEEQRADLTLQSCVNRYSFDIDGETYGGGFNTVEQRATKNGDEVALMYKSNDPVINSKQAMSPQTWGYILGGAGLLIFLFAGGSYMFTKKVKGAGTIQAASTGIGAMKGLFNQI